MNKVLPAPIQTIGLLTSGGDAPGMNAAIRAITRMGSFYKKNMIGVLAGYEGLLSGSYKSLNSSDMSNILQKGGTVLKSGRCLDFLTEENRSKAVENLSNKGIDGLICIGGDGTAKGAHALWKEHSFPVICIPATIDNDIYGTDYSIGFDTAINTALNAIDRIRDTAASHDRLFIVEVMGRETGFIAMSVGLSGGAEEVFIPESFITIDKTIKHIKAGMARGKTSSILIAAEGHKPGRAYDLAEAIRKKAGFNASICILGHIQRGGAPTARDRILGSQLGAQSVRLLLKGFANVLVGVQKESLATEALEQVITNNKKVNLEMLDLIHVLSL